MLYYRIFHVTEASSCKHIKQLKNMDITLVITIVKSLFISFGWPSEAFEWPSEAFEWPSEACKRRFWLAEWMILTCWPDDSGLLNEPYNDALMVSQEWCHRFRKALGHLSKNCLKSFKWNSDNSPMTLRRVAKEVKKGAQGRSIGFRMTL